MSVGHIYAMADDGKYYRDPTVRGTAPDGRLWFLCFDDDDPPEFVIEHKLEETPEQCSTVARAVLAQLGIDASRRHRHRAGRCFNSIRDIREARSFFLTIHGSIPAKVFTDAGHVGQTWI